MDGSEKQLDRPFLRVWLCGPLEIAWVHPITGEVLSAADSLATERDRAAALALLSLLLCQPNRQAYRDWIMEQFWPENGRSAATHRLENVFSSLRRILRPPSAGDSLLRSTRGTRAKGVLYVLDAYPQLWTDSDAIAWNVEQAARMERFGEDSLPFWERAFALLKRGSYLPDEPYADWALERRELLEGFLRQCVHALWRLYIARHAEAGKAEALLLLRTYWQQHKTDEDDLRPLLELLGEQERYQEAEAYYQQLLLALAEQEPDKEEPPHTPDIRTRDIHEYLHTKQIQRKRIIHSYPFGSTSKVVSLERQISGSLRHAYLASETTPQHQMLSSPKPYERLARALTTSSALDDKTLEGIDHITRTYWSLCRSIGYRNMLAGLLGHLEAIIQLLEISQPPTTYRYLRASASEVAQYIGAIYFDMRDYISAYAYYAVATKAAEEAESATLQATSLGRKSSLFIYSDNPREAILTLERAQHIATCHSSATILAWIAALQAEAYAHLHDEEACLKSLKRAEDLLQHTPCEENHHGIQFDYPRLVGYKGVCFLHLEQPSVAIAVLKEGATLTTTLSPRQRAIMLADTADAYRQQGKIEEACNGALDALEIGDQTKSHLLFHRLSKILNHMEPWRDLQAVKNFAKQMTAQTSLAIQDPSLHMEESRRDLLPEP